MEAALKVTGNSLSATGAGHRIASEEIPEERRVELDTTIAAMDPRAREMNSKYKETSEGGLAVSVVLC